MIRRIWPASNDASRRFSISGDQVAETACETALWGI